MASYLVVSSGSGTASNACLQCRKVKMRCRLPPLSNKCERCTRKSFDCEFHQHRRGRKPGTRIPAAVRQRAVDPHQQNASNTMSSTASEMLDQNNMPTISERASSADRPSSSAADESRERQDFWTQSDGFQPSDVLNRQAMKGRFSLQNILSTTHGQEPPATRPPISGDDPVQKGLINEPIALSLFEGFMKHLNPFISQLDPAFHSFSYVRSSSAFLFSSMLAAASKSLHPSLYSALHAHAENLFMESFRQGKKSVEVVQAIMILTYWKEPDDTRAWLSIGYAIRIAMELGWHKLVLRTSEQTQHLSNFEARQTRNDERTWLVLFVYDRSISLQTGKPWMIERNEFIESSQAWLRSPLATSNDPLLCAFVSLRLITSDVFETTDFHGLKAQRKESVQYRSLVRLLERQIEEWQTKWTRAVRSDGELCHQFLVPFYGNYARLLLFSSPLHKSLPSAKSNASVDTEAVWNSYSSALEMLKLVSQASTAQPLYFAQDSVHVMIAYATVFLIKLLLSAPEFIRKEIEEPVLEAIGNAAHNFSKQSAPESTGCALQARFLENVLKEYDMMAHRRRAVEPRSINTGHTSYDPQPTRLQQNRNAGPSGNNMISIGALERPSGQSISQPSQAGSLALSGPSALIAENVASRTSGVPAERAMPCNHASSGQIASADSGYDEYLSAVSPHSQDFTFSDDELWTTMFANAGFSVNEGMFLPSVYN